MGFIKLYVYFICFSFLVSLIIYLKPRPKEFYLKLFPPFLLATLIVETYGLYLGSKNMNNVAFYNFFSAFEFCFYLFVIGSVVTRKLAKQIILILIILYSIFSIINILFIQGINIFHTVSYTVGCLLVALCCIYYFLELFRNPKSENLFYQPTFWICAGLLFYYCCTFPLFALLNHWQNISPVIQQNFAQIIWILNMILYSLFAFAFLCSKTRKYTLSPSSV